MGSVFQAGLQDTGIAGFEILVLAVLLSYCCHLLVVLLHHLCTVVGS